MALHVLQAIIPPAKEEPAKDKSEDKSAPSTS